MYTTTKDMLRHASEGGYAVGAFNAENAEMVWAVIAAAEECRAPVIIQTTPGTLRYFGPNYFAGMVTRAAEEASVPVALHLDHGSSRDLAERCISCGYSSIMIDGSALPYGENVSLSKAVCEAAEVSGIPVEGELGTVGGKEDGANSGGVGYTDPAQAADFVERTGVSSLAIAVGTSHGFYKTAPILNLDLITATRKRVGVPLVLHGASGLSGDIVSRAVRLGMAKVNFATELRGVYTKTIREFLAADNEAFDPKKYGEPARTAVKELVKGKISACLSDGRV
ncbi:MAG: class II fructose-bisphosphate aldolase family protein [Synergistaceae bacterium]|jgi:tagatose 1,6-diphosphate aldolase GatY/KbaY|nr:class II fructose-bisphosphate aldolase family protein [Synergistaceae bacterium]